MKNKRRDLVLTRSGDVDDQLIVRTSDDHPYAGISIAEWGAANCRLLHAILLDGAIAQHDIPFYLAYTATICDFASKYEWSSVLDYDHQYRERQAQYGYTWGTLNPNAELKLRRLPDRYTRRGKPGQTRPTTTSGDNEVCRQWLANGHCRFGRSCKYLHTQNLGDQRQQVPPKNDRPASTHTNSM